MPTATRRQARISEEQNTSQVSPGDEIALQAAGGAVVDLDMEDGEQQVAEEEEEEVQEEFEPEPFPPPGLKEISSLASWTVSTAKPGNGVAALRSPDMSHFWQSDGPQPHLLSIHFFKLVEVVRMRLYLDFEADESYTPTKMEFWAGMGPNDLVCFAEMGFETPVGWVDVDFSGVGPMEDEDGEGEVDWGKRPVLRAFVVQVRILENHQNGKDTHLRGVQIFARDEGFEGRRRKGDEVRSPLKKGRGLALPARGGKAAAVKERNNIKKAMWMMEPDLR